MSPTRIQWYGCPGSPGSAPRPPPPDSGLPCSAGDCPTPRPPEADPTCSRRTWCSGDRGLPSKGHEEAGWAWKVETAQFTEGWRSFPVEPAPWGRALARISLSGCRPTRPAFLPFIEGMSWGEALQGRPAELLPAQRRLWTPMMSPPPQGRPRRRQCSPVLPDACCGQLGDSPSGYLFPPGGNEFPWTREV